MDNNNESGGLEIYDSPEALQEAMQVDENQPAPVAAETPTEVAPEPVVETQTEPTPTPEPMAEGGVIEAQEPNVVPETQTEPTQEDPPQEVAQQQETIEKHKTVSQPQYSDNEIEGAVMSYISEKLGKDVTTLDDLFAQQQPLDERVDAIAKFVAETGRSPREWFTYQSLSTSEMDDLTMLKVDMSLQYPTLSADEVTTLVQSKYSLDTEKHSEQEVKVANLQMKIDASKAKEQIEEQRMRYAAPEPKQEEAPAPQTIANEQWLTNMKKEASALTGLEFDLGNNKSFTFGLDDRYKQELVNRNANIDKHFDSYVRSDGSWDYDTLSSHHAIIDNIDAIVASTYRQGLSDGQKNIVNSASNVSTQTPSQSAQSTNNPLAEQIKNIMDSGRSKTTFKI